MAEHAAAWLGAASITILVRRGLTFNSAGMALAPVGVLLAVLGYALGTYCAYITGLILQAMAGG